MPEEEIQTADGGIFEYEIRELPAQRDGNQIYGVTHQNGIQYAEKLAEHGFMVYCFDFCGDSNNSQGGLVYGITAAANQEDIQGLILLYPGFEIVEDAQALFASADEIPDLDG